MYIFWVWNLTYVHKSSLMLTMMLSVEDKTAQYFWNTFDDIRHRIEKKNKNKIRHSKTKAFTKIIFCHASGSQLLILTWAVNSKLDETAELSSHLEFLEHSKTYTAFNVSMLLYTWKSHWLKTSDVYINYVIRISNKTAQVFQANFSSSSVSV